MEDSLLTVIGSWIFWVGMAAFFVGLYVYRKNNFKKKK